MNRARRQEASQASLVFHASLIRLGFEATLDALELWEDVQTQPARIAASVGRFVARILSVLGGNRKAARRLALSYTVYHRALLTGYTLGEGTSANVRDLRESFYTEVAQATPGLLEDDRSLVDVDGVQVTGPPSSSDFVVNVEPLPVLPIDELDDEAEDQLIAQIKNSAQRSLQKKSSAAGSADETDFKRDQAHTEAGSLAAGAVQRGVLNGGREVVDGIAKDDKRVIAFVRVSGTGTPCGWCAMLLSRGPVYRSEKSAETQADGRKYHDNCACYAIPLYSTEEYDEDPRFDLNRELSDDWARETRGLGGKRAVTAFRRFIRDKYKPQEAQAAA